VASSVARRVGRTGGGDEGGSCAAREIELIGLRSKKGIQDLRSIFGVDGSDGYEWRLSTYAVEMSECTRLLHDGRDGGTGQIAIHTFDEEYHKQGGEAVKIMSISVDQIRGCTCTMSPVQRPMFVYCLTWGSWRRSKASCKRWTNAVERMTPLGESIGGVEIRKSGADLCQSAFRQRRRWGGCGDSETFSRLRGM
jgi:hypothetical protein